jgi:hypothetical protein
MTPADILATMQEAPAMRRAIAFESFDYRACPPDRLEELLRYLLAWDGHFAEVGDARLYCAHLQRLTDHLHTRVFENPADRFWLQIASVYTRRAKLVPLYFTDANVRSVVSQRGDLLELVLRAVGHAVDYDFAPRQRGRRIRLGFVIPPLGDIVTTTPTPPMFEHVDRSRFEIVIFFTHQLGSSGERYYAQLADRTVVIGDDLRSKRRGDSQRGYRSTPHRRESNRLAAPLGQACGSPPGSNPNPRHNHTDHHRAAPCRCIHQRSPQRSAERVRALSRDAHPDGRHRNLL